MAIKLSRSQNKREMVSQLGSGCSSSIPWTPIEIKLEPPDDSLSSEEEGSSYGYSFTFEDSLNFLQSTGETIKKEELDLPNTDELYSGNLEGAFIDNKVKSKSNAESMRRYRQKIKMDPVRHERYKERERIRNYRRRYQRILRVSPEKRTPLQQQIVLDFMMGKEADLSKMRRKRKKAPCDQPTSSTVESIKFPTKETSTLHDQAQGQFEIHQPDLNLFAESKRDLLQKQIALNYILGKEANLFNMRRNKQKSPCDRPTSPTVESIELFTNETSPVHEQALDKPEIHQPNKKSNAKSARKYRMKIKSDPVRYEQYKEQNRIRYHQRQNRRVMLKKRTIHQKQMALEFMKDNEADMSQMRLKTREVSCDNPTAQESKQSFNAIKTKTPQKETEFHAVFLPSFDDQYQDTSLPLNKPIIKIEPSETKFSAKDLLQELFGDIVDVYKKPTTSQPKPINVEMPQNTRHPDSLRDPSVLTNRNSVQSARNLKSIQLADKRSQNLAANRTSVRDQQNIPCSSNRRRPLAKPSESNGPSPGINHILSKNILCEHNYSSCS